MAEPTLPDLQARVMTLEDWKADTADAVKSLQIAMAKLEADTDSIKERLIHADAARDRQTDILLSEIRDNNKRAMNQVPVWASTMITILAMLCAALLTSHYG